MASQKKEMPCERLKYMEPLKRSNNWLILASGLCEKAPIAWQHDCTLWRLIWKARLRQRSPRLLRFIGQKSVNGFAGGKKMGLKDCWKDIEQGDQNVCPKNNAKPLAIFSTVARWPTDSIPAYGHVQWFPESLKKNFLFVIILPMSPEFFMNLNSPFNGLKKYSLELIRHFNHGGLVTNIPSSKKSQKRKSGTSLRGRSQFPTRPDSSPDMGKSRMSAGNSQYGTTQYSQNFRNHRIIPRPIPLSFSESFQCTNLYRISRENSAQLLPSENLSYPRQRFLSQRPHRVGLVPQSSTAYRSLQSSSIFSGLQCVGKNLASHASLRHAQQIFQNAIRTQINFNFHLSQHSTQPTTNHGLSSSLSIKLCSFIYTSLYSRDEAIFLEFKRLLRRR